MPLSRFLQGAFVTYAVRSRIITGQIGKQGNTLKPLKGKKPATILQINVALPPDFSENKFMATYKSQIA